MVRKYLILLDINKEGVIPLFLYIINYVLFLGGNHYDTFSKRINKKRYFI